MSYDIFEGPYFSPREQRKIHGRFATLAERIDIIDVNSDKLAGLGCHIFRDLQEGPFPRRDGLRNYISSRVDDLFKKGYLKDVNPDYVVTAIFDDIEKGLETFK